ncbi:unnamed protein product [Ranitomeya imitator]|uniref:Uncharacterized protein n=1 Tax=Ranitomeya imitator TaxID=111125 RepID=A0ABN9L5L3_9NEOB|nr:unnamed protein product [Ranitomeya imitator]
MFFYLNAKVFSNDYSTLASSAFVLSDLFHPIISALILKVLLPYRASDGGNEIESIVQFESDCMDSVVGLSRNEVVWCPVCNRNYLTITSCFVMCRCGVYINCKV